MLRVWYSYAISVVFSYATFRGLIFGFSLVLFLSLVSLPDIVFNLLNVRVGAVPEYLWQTIASAVTDGEFLKLLTLGVIIFSVLSLRFRVPVMTSPRVT